MTDILKSKEYKKMTNYQKRFVLIENIDLYADRTKQLLTELIGVSIE